MAKAKKRRWFEHREYTNDRHQLRDARTGKMLISDGSRAQIDAYIAKATEADGVPPEISYDKR